MKDVISDAHGCPSFPKTEVSSALEIPFSEGFQLLKLILECSSFDLRNCYFYTCIILETDSLIQISP